MGPELQAISRADLLAEAYKRGLLPPDKKAAYEEAQRRGLLTPQPGESPRAELERLREIKRLGLLEAEASELLRVRLAISSLCTDLPNKYAIYNAKPHYKTKEELSEDELAELQAYVINTAQHRRAVERLRAFCGAENR